MTQQRRLSSLGTNVATPTHSPSSKGVIAQVELTMDKSLQLPACNEMEVMVKAPGGVAGKTCSMATRKSKRSAITILRVPGWPTEPPRRGSGCAKRGGYCSDGGTGGAHFGVNAVGVGPNTTAIVPNEKQETLWDMVAATADSLDCSQQNLLFSLLLEFADVLPQTLITWGEQELSFIQLTQEVPHPFVNRIAESHSYFGKKPSSCKAC